MLTLYIVALNKFAEMQISRQSSISLPFYTQLSAIEQVVGNLRSDFHFALSSAMDHNGVKKEIYWKLSPLQVPVVRPPLGDDKILQFSWMLDWSTLRISLSNGNSFG
jgi:hypothetical protein